MHTSGSPGAQWPCAWIRVVHPGRNTWSYACIQVIHPGYVFKETLVHNNFGTEAHLRDPRGRV